ncbi:hypothetical protein HQ524_01890 [Candidatus Uhrbacteria bacterium]|nr:hypothetical protein [Candidatus Uhrbacteria bacterium]
MEDGSLFYRGNVSHPEGPVTQPTIDKEELINRFFEGSDVWSAVHKIDSEIFNATVSYFQKLGASWTNLPQTTRMISSPGEIYAGQTIDYTTDTAPVVIKDWFDSGRSIFLSESSQFYLEMRLAHPKIEQVFSIYNSFRKEKEDATHLSEFQHIEYEGKVDFEGSVDVLTGLVRSITRHVIEECSNELSQFLTGEEILGLSDFCEHDIPKVRFSEAMKMLEEATGDSKYSNHTLLHFGAW